MEQNVGMQDRLLRLGFVIITILAYLLGLLRGKSGLILVVSGMLLSSVLSGNCILYQQFGLSTKESPKGH